MPRRSRPMARASAMRRTGALRRLALTAATRSRRRTGFGRAAKAVIFDRDRHACVIAVECDGRPGTAQTVHHLENRGAGGSPQANAVTNGVACCHLCNAWLEDHPLIAYAKGWKRRRGQTGPVLYADGWHQLLPDGTRRPA